MKMRKGKWISHFSFLILNRHQKWKISFLTSAFPHFRPQTKHTMHWISSSGVYFVNFEFLFFRLYTSPWKHPNTFGRRGWIVTSQENILFINFKTAIWLQESRKLYLNCWFKQIWIQEQWKHCFNHRRNKFTVTRVRLYPNKWAAPLKSLGNLHRHQKQKWFIRGREGNTCEPTWYMQELISKFLHNNFKVLFEL